MLSRTGHQPKHLRSHRYCGLSRGGSRLYQPHWHRRCRHPWRSGSLTATLTQPGAHVVVSWQSETDFQRSDADIDPLRVSEHVLWRDRAKYEVLTATPRIGPDFRVVSSGIEPRLSIGAGGAWANNRRASLRQKDHNGSRGIAACATNRVKRVRHPGRCPTHSLKHSIQPCQTTAPTHAFSPAYRAGH